MQTIIIDWAQTPDSNALYESVLTQMHAPEWHGRNLDALNDSWVNGEVSTIHPPFHFVLRNEKLATANLRVFASAIRSIAEASVLAHGGSVKTETT